MAIYHPHPNLPPSRGKGLFQRFLLGVGADLGVCPGNLGVCPKPRAHTQVRPYPLKPSVEANLGVCPGNLGVCPGNLGVCPGNLGVWPKPRAHTQVRPYPLKPSVGADLGVCPGNRPTNTTTVIPAN